MIIYLAGLKGIPGDLYEAAELDGANKVQRLFRITIPQLTPTIFFNLVISIIGSFQVFTQAYAMTQGGPRKSTSVLHVLPVRYGVQSSVWATPRRGLDPLRDYPRFTLLVIRSSSLWVYYGSENNKADDSSRSL